MGQTTKMMMLLAALICVSIAHGGLVVNTTAPTSTIITHPTGASFTRSFGETTNLQARGQSFLMPDTGDANTTYSVSSITVQKDADQTFEDGDIVKLWVFDYAASWTSGTQNGTGDPLANTTLTALSADVNGASFSLGTIQVSNNAYLHFTFSPPLAMVENTAYGVLLQYVEADPATGPDWLRLKQGDGSVSTYPDGALLSIGDAGTHTLRTVDLTFWVSGSIPPTGIVADFADSVPVPNGTGPAYDGTETPPTGWAYLWADTGDIGDAARYAALQPNTVGAEPTRSTPQWTADGSLVFNDTAQGNARFLRVSAGSLHPGNGGQDAQAIVAYTLQDGDAGVLSITNSSLQNVSANGDGVALSVYVNDVLQPGFSSTVDGGTIQFDGDLGFLRAGDTVYVAVGNGASNDSGSDASILDFQLLSSNPPSTVFVVW